MPIPKETQKDHFNYAQYRNWPVEERWELIDGKAYNMSPAPGMTHQDISGALFSQIYNFLDEKPCKVFTAPFDVFLPEKGESEDETSTIVQPDILIICDLSKLSEKGCTGPPDIVIEIISPSSAVRDQIKKLSLYERRGVKEYWIIHPIDKIVWKYILENGHYGKPFIYDATSSPSFNLFPDLNIDLRKVFGISNKGPKEGVAKERPAPAGGGQPKPE